MKNDGITVEAKITSKSMKKIAEMAVAMIEQKVKIPPAKEVKKGYSLNELEDLYNIKALTLARHIRDGLLKASKPGKSYVVLKEDFETYLKQNRNE